MVTGNGCIAPRYTRIKATPKHKPNADAGRDAQLLGIARRQFRIETLETRNRDRLDFHDVAVWAGAAAIGLSGADYRLFAPSARSGILNIDPVGNLGGYQTRMHGQQDEFCVERITLNDCRFHTVVGLIRCLIAVA